MKMSIKNEYYKKYPWLHSLMLAKQRCNNKKNNRYKTYGGRGIKLFLTKEAIKKLWFRDKAFNMIKPSIDRINNDGNYGFSNCRFIETSDNVIKSKEKIINQYDLQGKFIKSWKSQIEIQNTLGFLQCCISDVCRKKQKTAYSFIWKFKKER